MENLKSSCTKNFSENQSSTLQQSCNNRKQRSLFKCNICSKIFSNSSAIAKHRLTHSEERKYSCPICRKAFKRQDHLNGHKLTHETKRPHGCRFCDKSYSDSRSLRRHYENAHVEEYEKWKLLVTSLKLEDQGIEIDKEMIANCENDDASSKFVKALWMSYSLEEPKKVSCQVCGKKFKNQPALNGHMRLHGGYSLINGSENNENSSISDKLIPESVDSNAEYQEKSSKSQLREKKARKSSKLTTNMMNDANLCFQYEPSSTMSDNTDNSSFDSKPQRFNSQDLYASSSNNSSRSNLTRNDWSNISTNNQNAYEDSSHSSSFIIEKTSSSLDLLKKENLFHHLLTDDQRNFQPDNNGQVVRRRHESGFPQYSGFKNPTSLSHLSNDVTYQPSNVHPSQLHNSLQQEKFLPSLAKRTEKPIDLNIANNTASCSTIISSVQQLQTTVPKTNQSSNITCIITENTLKNDIDEKENKNFKAVAYFGNKPLPCTGPFGAHYSPVTPAPDSFPVDSMNLKRKATDQLSSDERYSKFQFDSDLTVNVSKNARFDENTPYTWNSTNLLISSPGKNIDRDNPSTNTAQNSCESSNCLFDFKENVISAFSMNFSNTHPISEAKENFDNNHVKTKLHSNSITLNATDKLALTVDQNSQKVPIVAHDNWIFEKEIINATKETFFDNPNGTESIQSQTLTIYEEDKRLPKKKRRPAPLYIHPNVTGNMSRLRTPLPPNKDKSKFLAPYTPPPMLSPNRKGSGLFYNLKKKPKSSLFRCLSECHSTDYSSENSLTNCNNNDFINKDSKKYIEKNIIKSCHYNQSPMKTTQNGGNNSDKAPKSAPLPNVPFGYFNDSVDCEKNATTELSQAEINDRQVSPNAFDFNFTEDQLDMHAFTQSKRESAFTYDEEEEDSEEFEDIDGVPTNSIPTINIGKEYQAVLPECNYQKTKEQIIEDYSKSESWEKSLWYPENFNDDDPKNKDSLDLLMKIACSAAVRNCGLNMEYAFHLLCKYKGDLEKTLQSLLRDCLVVYDYVYAETTVWSKEEIIKFQEGLNEFGRDFYLIAKKMNANGINKTVKACVEFYYVWKRMNNPAEVKRYRSTKSRKEKQKKSQENNKSLKQSSPPPPINTPNIDIESLDDNKTPVLPKIKMNSEICLELVTPQTSTASVATSIKTYNDKIDDPIDRSIILNHRSVLCEECGEILQDEHICSEWLVRNEKNVSNYHVNAQNQRFDPCKYCGRVFFRSKSRQTHMKLHHSIKTLN